MNFKRIANDGVDHPIEIYGLFDPDGFLRYIGKAKDSKKRFKGHLRDCFRRKTPVYCWIKSLLAKNQAPSMKVIGISTESNWQQSEREFISAARSSGERLLNVADGGDEPFCSNETRSKNGRSTAKIIKEFPFWIHASKSMTHAIKSAFENKDLARIHLYSEAKKSLAGMTDCQKRRFNQEFQSK